MTVTEIPSSTRILPKNVSSVSKDNKLIRVSARQQLLAQNSSSRPNYNLIGSIAASIIQNIIEKFFARTQPIHQQLGKKRIL